LRGIAPDITTVSAVILGYDPASSDGLSEMGDSNHKNRVAKRQISYIEYLDLKSLAFFDDTNQDHITVKETSGGEVKYLTYLPQFDDILPKNSDPKTIEDYYFASETDVSASYKHLSQAELGSPNSITFQLNPYEVVELSIGHSTKLADLSDTSDASGIAALPSAPGRIKLMAQYSSGRQVKARYGHKMTLRTQRSQIRQPHRKAVLCLVITQPIKFKQGPARMSCPAAAVMIFYSLRGAMILLPGARVMTVLMAALAAILSKAAQGLIASYFAILMNQTEI